MTDRGHTMQFRFNNEESNKKTFKLFNVPNAVGDIEETIDETIIIKNNSVNTTASYSSDIGQTWLQTEDALLKKVGIKIIILTDSVATLEIYNYDTSVLMETYSNILLSSSYADDYFYISTELNLQAGVNYYFKLTATIKPKTFISNLNPYPDGFAILDGVINATSDLGFIIECNKEILMSDNIETTGSLDYDDLVRSLAGKPIKINTISIISSTKEQLDNNFEFSNVEIQGHIQNFKLNVAKYSSPLDVTNIVKIKLSKPVIFGSDVNETLEYSVNGNTEVSLIFGFEFEERVQDAEFEILEDEISENNEKVNEVYQTEVDTKIKRNKKLQLSNKIQEINNLNQKEDLRIQSFLIGTLITLTLINIISWIKK